MDKFKLRCLLGTQVEIWIERCLHVSGVQERGQSERNAGESSRIERVLRAKKLDAAVSVDRAKKRSKNRTLKSCKISRSSEVRKDQDRTSKKDGSKREENNNLKSGILEAK